MGAFKGAVEVGTDAIETDIHLTKDDVVVLSHVSRYTGDRQAHALTVFPRTQRLNDVLEKKTKL